MGAADPLNGLNTARDESLRLLSEGLSDNVSLGGGGEVAAHCIVNLCGEALWLEANAVPATKIIHPFSFNMCCISNPSYCIFPNIQLQFAGVSTEGSHIHCYNCKITQDKVYEN